MSMCKHRRIHAHRYIDVAFWNIVVRTALLYLCTLMSIYVYLYMYTQCRFNFCISRCIYEYRYLYIAISNEVMCCGALQCVAVHTNTDISI